jgi:cytochrome c553
VPGAPRAVDPGQVELALKLTPNLSRGASQYQRCSGCHGRHGQGSNDGRVPVLAGQHRDYLTTRLLRMRLGGAGASSAPYHSIDDAALRSIQSIVDIAGYLGSLPAVAGSQRGSEQDLQLGSRVFEARCTECHGTGALGQPDMLVPRIRAQNYGYLRRQITDLAEGHRMPRGSPVTEVLGMLTPAEADAVAAYISQLSAMP